MDLLTVTNHNVRHIFEHTATQKPFINVPPIMFFIDPTELKLVTFW